MRRAFSLAFVVVLVACGGDDDSADTDSGTDPRRDGGRFDAARPDDAGRTDAPPVPFDAGPPGPLAEVIEALPSGTWLELADTQMSSVCPTTKNHYVCDAVMGAWSGAAYDADLDRLIVFGGGHADSFLNNVFVFTLTAGEWTRATELPAPLDGLPDGGPVPSVFRDIRIESCGLYPSVGTLTIPDEWLTATGYLMSDRCDDPSIVPQLDDQQPRSAHSYGNIAVVASRFYILGSAGLYQSGQSGSSRVSIYDFGARRWTRGPDNPITGYGASAVDARGHVYYVGDRRVSELDPVAGTWTPIANADEATGYYAGAAVDTTRNVLVATQDGVTLQTWDLASEAYAAVTTTGLSGLGQAPGFEYAADADRFYAWSGGRDVNVFDPATVAWTTVTGTGDDPGPQAGNGTFGRFRYSPRYRVLVAVSSTTSNVFVFKP